MNQSGLAIGVLAASTKQLGELNRLVKGAGFSVTASVELRQEPPKTLPPVDVWVVNLDMHEVRAQVVVDHIEALNLPVIYEEDLDIHHTDASPNSTEKPLTPTDMRIKKERRIASKLHHLVREPHVQSPALALRRADQVWVLAASTGGPEAVAEFLDGLPDDLEGVALLYAQHIEAQALTNLRMVVQKHCNWAVQFTDQAQVIREKTVYILSPLHQIELSDAGVLSPLQEPWGGRYRPSIDQVIAKVARVYRKKGGAIVFSGMGDDGANSCTLLHHRGGQVWIQATSTCTIDSMPASVEKNGSAGFSAKPSDLARQFVQYHKYGQVPPQNPRR